MSQRGIASQQQILASRTPRQQQQRLASQVPSQSQQQRRARQKRQQQLRKRQQQQKGRKVQAQESRKYMKAILQMADEQGEPIKFTLKFKKFLGDLVAALGTLLAGDSHAKSRIVFTVGGPDGMPAILEGRKVTRPYTDKQLPLAVSSDDSSDRRLIEFTIRPMNAKEMAQFTQKRQQKARGSMSKFIDSRISQAATSASTMADATSKGFKKTKQFFGKLKLF
jgi:hypothetical protein